jgi:hypothetical protein
MLYTADDHAVNNTACEYDAHLDFQASRAFVVTHCKCNCNGSSCRGWARAKLCQMLARPSPSPPFPQTQGHDPTTHRGLRLEPPRGLFRIGAEQVLAGQHRGQARIESRRTCARVAAGKGTRHAQPAILQGPMRTSIAGQHQRPRSPRESLPQDARRFRRGRCARHGTDCPS